MKSISVDIIKSYIFIWYINVGDIAPNDDPSYVEAAKHSLVETDRLNELLNADVITYFIPTRVEPTRLEVLEFNINSNDPFSRSSNGSIADLEEMKEKLAEVISSFNNKK